MRMIDDKEMIEKIHQIQEEFIMSKYDLEQLIHIVNKIEDAFEYWLKDEDYFLGSSEYSFSECKAIYFYGGSGGYDYEVAIRFVDDINDIFHHLINYITFDEYGDGWNVYGYSYIDNEKIVRCIIELFDSLMSNFKDIVNEKTIKYFYKKLIIFAFNNQAFSLAKNIYERNREYISSCIILQEINNLFFRPDFANDRDEYEKIAKKPYYREWVPYNERIAFRVLFSPKEIAVPNREMANLIVKIYDDAGNYSNNKMAIISFLTDIDHIFSKDSIFAIRNTIFATCAFFDAFFNDNMKYFDAKSIKRLADEHANTQKPDDDENYHYDIVNYDDTHFDSVSKMCFDCHEKYEKHKRTMKRLINEIEIFAFDETINDDEIVERFKTVAKVTNALFHIKGLIIELFRIVNIYLYTTLAERGQVLAFPKNDKEVAFTLRYLNFDNSDIINYRSYEYSSFMDEYVYKSEFYSSFEKQIKLVADLERIVSKKDSEFINEKVESIKRNLSMDNKDDNYKPLLEYAYDILDKCNDIYVSKLYEERDMGIEEKGKIIKEFLSLGSFENSRLDLSDAKLSLLFSKIQANTRIVNQIISGELLARKYDNLDSEYNSLDGDYIFMVVCQIKAIERFLKEVLVQNYPHNIRIRDRYTGEITKPVKFRDYSNLTSDNLSKTERINGERYGETFELGPTSLAIQIAMIGSNPKYNGIFKPLNNNNYMNFPFYNSFICKVRNGYLHNDMINTVEKANIIRRKVAYWFYMCISELPRLQK